MNDWYLVSKRHTHLLGAVPDMVKEGKLLLKCYMVFLVRGEGVVLTPHKVPTSFPQGSFSTNQNIE